MRSSMTVPYSCHRIEKAREEGPAGRLPPLVLPRTLISSSERNLHEFAISLARRIGYFKNMNDEREKSSENSMLQIPAHTPTCLPHWITLRPARLKTTTMIGQLHPKSQSESPVHKHNTGHRRSTSQPPSPTI